MAYYPSEIARKEAIDRRVFQTTYRTFFHIILISFWLIMTEKGKDGGGILIAFQLLFLIEEWSRVHHGDRSDYLGLAGIQVILILFWLSMPFQLGTIVGMALQAITAIPTIHCVISSEACRQWVS